MLDGSVAAFGSCERDYERNSFDEDPNKIEHPERINTSVRLATLKLDRIQCSKCGKEFKGIRMRMPQYCSDCDKERTNKINTNYKS